MIIVFDFIVLAVFFYVQWRITRRLLRWSAERWSGRRLKAARVAIFTADTLLVVGYLLSFSWLFAWLHIPGDLDSYLEAATLAYLLSASGALALRAIIRWIGRHWNREADPGRRRVLRLAGQGAVVAPMAVLGYGTFIQRLDLRVREVDVPIAGLPRISKGCGFCRSATFTAGRF